MADNVTVDNAALAQYVVATDEITSPYTGGTAHAAAVKILSGTADSNAVIPGDATNGLDVDVTRVPADPFGANADAAVVTDAAGSMQGKLRGLVKWAFERMPASLGQKAMGASFPVVVASDQSAVPVSGTVTANAGTGTFAVDSELTTADLDTGVGTDTRAVVGLVKAASGGGVLVSDASPLPISDAGGSVTVDGTVGVSGTVTVDSELTTADLDTGAGTDNRAVVGLVVAKSGGAANISNTDPLPISDAAGSLTVDNGGTFAVQDSEKMIDNAAFTDGSTKVQPAGYVLDETAGTALTENDAAAARIDSKRAQVLVLEDESTRGRRATVTAANALKVDGSAVTQPVSGTVTAVASGDHTVVGKAADGAAVTGNPVLVGGQDGTNAQSLKTDTVGRLEVVDGGLSLTVDNAGTFAVQAASAGDVAHDGVDSGNPVKVGAKAVAHGANPTAVAAADRTDLYANRAGIQFTIGGHPNAKSATYITTAAGTDDNVMAAIAAGLKYAVTRITITLDEATTVGVACRLGFGATTVPALGASQADAVDDILVYHPGIVPGGGLTIGDGSGILGVGGDGAELRITNEVPTSGTLAVTVTYFTIES